MEDIIETLNNWYFQEWFITGVSVIAFLLGSVNPWFFLGFFVSTFLMFKKHQLEEVIKGYALKVSSLDALKDEVEHHEHLLVEIRKQLTVQVEAELAGQQDEIRKRSATLKKLEKELENRQIRMGELDKEIDQAEKKSKKMKKLYEPLKYALDSKQLLSDSNQEILEEVYPSINLSLPPLDAKQLRKQIQANNKDIKEVSDYFIKNCNVKSHILIYRLLKEASIAEVKNVIYGVQNGKLSSNRKLVQQITQKYCNLVFEENPTLANEMEQFLSQIEYFNLKSINDAYLYYTHQRQEREEQALLREQMKQEQNEIKKLEEQRQKVDQEEAKFLAEIQKAKHKLELVEPENKLTNQLKDRIATLERQLKEVEIQKEEIIKLQNGKAGYVYVISNLGSFGDNVFKVGMTRRLDPQDRVDELSCASVPFIFDVHSFIFSDNAVALEKKIHTALEPYRVNKENKRKEFFRVSIDEIEKLICEIDPTANFTRTMIARDYRASLEYTV